MEEPNLFYIPDESPNASLNNQSSNGLNGLEEFNDLLKPKIFSVSQVTGKIKDFLKQEFSSIWVRGEVSEARSSSTGHLYFTLKDETTSLSCVMFHGRLTRLKFKIIPGTVFQCLGDISVYEKRGSYQLIVSEVLPEGQGELELAFKQMRDKLETEGLFSDEHKRPIPKYPKRVGLITSDTGAAVRDVLKTMEVEYPQVEVVIFPVPVQGAVEEKIASMIEKVNQHDWVDVIILTRGGGSREDLWVFNEERVARAVFASELPIISAVGHEVDLVISDLVADYRCSTPTQAGNLVSRYKKELAFELPVVSDRLGRAMKAILMNIKLQVNNFSMERWQQVFKQKIRFLVQDKIAAEKALSNVVSQSLVSKKNEAVVLQQKLNSLSPKKILERGFALVTKNDKVVTDLTTLETDEEVKIYIKRDQVSAKINSKTIKKG